MIERPIDIARRAVRRAFLRVESLERRDCPSHVLPTNHQVNPPAHHNSAAIRSEDVQPGFAQQGNTPPGAAAAAEIIKDPGFILRVIAGGVPFIPGGPIAPPVVANPAPVPVAPVNPPVVAH